MSYCTILLSFSLNLLSAEEPRPVVSPGIDDFISSSFRIDETLKVTLDGSPAASDIERERVTQNRLVFVDTAHWRAMRQLPLPGSIREYLSDAGTIFRMTGSNKKNVTRVPPTNLFWEEIILSPLQLAKEWSLADRSENFDSWLKDLRKAKSPLTNVEGDKIEFNFMDDSNIRILSTGKIMQDGKTLVKVESHWEMTGRGKVNSTSLVNSLLRSN